MYEIKSIQDIDITNDYVKNMIAATKQDALKYLELKNEHLQKLLHIIKHKIKAINKELSETETSKIELNDLIEYKKKLNHTITLAEDLRLCFEVLSIFTELYNRITEKSSASIDELIELIAMINNAVNSKDFTYLLEYYDDKDNSALLNPYAQAPYID